MGLRRMRDYEVERRERESFILLQHAYTLAEANPEAILSGAHMVDDLGFARDAGLRLIEHLVREGYFTDHGTGPRISISRQGIEYIERFAWRRRSIRFRFRGRPPGPRA